MSKRVLFAPSGVGFAHLGRCLKVADALRKLGYETPFAYGGTHVDEIDARGHARVPIPEVAPDSFRESPLLAYRDDFGRRCVEAERAAIRATGAGAVVSDLRPTTSISTRLEKVGSIVLKNAALCDDFDHGAIFGARSAAQKMAAMLARTVVPLRAADLGRGLSKLAREYNVSGLSSLYDFFGGDLELVCDLTEFAPLRREHQGRHVVGPVIWDGGPGPRSPVDTHDPTGRIYATLGNTGDPALGRAVVEAFRDIPGIRVLLSTGAYQDPDQFQHPPANIRIVRFVDGAAAIANCEIAIHPAGDGTTYQCLRAGKPSVAVPFNSDQRIRAYLIAAHRVGVSILRTPLSPDVLQRAVRTALSDSEIGENVRGYARREYEGAALSAHRIHAFLSAQR